MTDNQLARRHRVPKAFRRYSKRYGRGISRLLQVYQQHIMVPRLDHWRDAKEAAQKLVAMLQERK